jgi:hypothetical protein
MSEPVTAVDLQLDACLREVFGDAPAPGLAERIGLRLRSATDAPRGGTDAPRGGWRGRLLAAALVLGGAAAVAGVAWLQRHESQRAAQPPDAQQPQPPQQPQDPKPTAGRLDQNQPLVQLLSESLRGLQTAEHRDDALAMLAELGARERGDDLAALLRRLGAGLQIDAATMQTAVDAVRDAVRPGNTPTREQVVKWLRDLAMPELRADARAELLRACRSALPIATEALAQERSAVLTRPAVVADLETLVHDLEARSRRFDDAARRAGLAGLGTTGDTMIADYSDNRVLEVDHDGKVVWELNDVYGAWDAEQLPSGNILITEFSVSRVSEVDREGNRIWVFEDLKNPYRASRLANGNTLIADTFGNRVIEVTPSKEIAWSYDTQIRPFGCVRLPDGNTLIADVLKDRVLEVTPAKEIVWEVHSMNNVHDAQRLPDGNTLITLRSAGEVIEVDRAGKVVWQLTGLMSPSSAHRLADGHTLVAENNRVREFDRDGKVVWEKQMTWAVQARRY